MTDPDLRPGPAPTADAGATRAARRAAHVAAFAAMRRIEGAARPLLLAARGTPGTVWHRDARLGRRRQVDVYAENLPEAMIDWAGRNGRRVYVVYLGRRPVFDADSPSYETLHGDLVREIDLAEFRRGWPAEPGAADAYDRLYRDTLFQDPDFRALFRVEGVDLFDSLAGQIDLLPRLAAGHVQSRALWTDLLRALEPAAIFGGRLDVRPDICAAAAETGVMTVTVKLGIGEEMLAPFALGDGDGRFDAASFPDVAAVWGESQKALIARRFPDCPAHVVVSGRTRNDSFAAALAPAARSPLRSRLHLGPDAEIVVYGANHLTHYGQAAGEDFGAPCMSLDGWTAFLRALVDLAQARPAAAVVVKPHPSDDLDALARVVDALNAADAAAGAPARCLLLTDGAGFHNAEILAEAAVFVSSASSMFSEALLAGALPVQIWTPEVNYLYETGRRDVFAPIALTVEDPAQMQAAVRRALDDPDFRRAETARLGGGLEAIFGPRDGGNARRLVAESMAHFAAGWRPRGGRAAGG